MERSLFFNSAPGDPRTYQASDFADYFGSVLFNGLLHVNGVPGLAVNVETNTLNTVVSPGGAIIEGYLYENTSALTLTHGIPEASLDRIDRVVLRLDLRNSERNIRIHIKEGTATASPVAPTLQRDNFIYELSLAQIKVRANTVQLLQSDLIDERLSENLCGLVKSLITDGVSEIAFNNHVSDHTDHVYYADDTGTANAKVVGISPVPSSYKKGIGISFTNAIQNTGAVTINVNGLGARAILKPNGEPLNNGKLKANSVYTVRYNGTSFILQGEGGEYGTAGASQVLQGYTVGTEDGVIAGTLMRGKKYAKGTFTTDSSGVYTVSGLSFKPRVIVIGLDSTNSGAIRIVALYSEEVRGRESEIDFSVNLYNKSFLTGGYFTINDNGFRFASGSAAQYLYNYIAYE